MFQQFKFRGSSSSLVCTLLNKSSISVRKILMISGTPDGVTICLCVLTFSYI